MTFSAAGDPQFHTTHWSLIAQAAERGSPQSQAALEELCRTYWYPVYAFIRRRQYQPDDARDLAQEFFTRLLEKEFLEDADAERGRFRAFLLTALSRFLSKERERGAAQKRGGGRRDLPLSVDDGESRYQREPSHEWTAERIFIRRWALTLLDRALGELREEHVAAGKEALFDKLKVFLTGEQGPPRQTIATELGMSEGAVKVAVHRLRQKYRERLRAEIAQTVAGPAEVDDELQILLSALRGESAG